MADDFQYVKLPDGSYGKFAANASDADIHAQISKDFPTEMAAAQDKPSLATRIQSSFDSNTSSLPNDTPVQTLLKSAVRGAGQMFVHPVDTAIATAKTAANVANPLRIGPPQFVKDAVHSVVEAPDKTKALANVAGGIVGGLAAGEVVTPIGAAALKTAGPAAGKVALLGKTPEGAYESALKPSTALDPALRGRIVQTGLRESIPVSKAGVEQLGDKVDTLNQEIAGQIAADPARPINTSPALRSLDKVRSRFANQVTPQPDLKEIDTVQRDFLNNPKLQPQGFGPAPASLGAADAQAMKTGTYRALGDKAYGEVKGASIEAQKSLARGLKDEIANAFPEIGNLNAAESKLLELKPVLERAVSRISNHQILGIGTPVTGAAVKAATGSGLVAGAGMMAKAVLDNPAIKSRVAILVSKGAKIPYADALARVAAYTGSAGATSIALPASTSGVYASLPTQ